MLCLHQGVRNYQRQCSLNQGIEELNKDEKWRIYQIMINKIIPFIDNFSKL